MSGFIDKSIYVNNIIGSSIQPNMSGNNQPNIMQFLSTGIQPNIIGSSVIHHHPVLINMQVQEHLPHQWAPLQVTG